MSNLHCLADPLTAEFDGHVHALARLGMGLFCMGLYCKLHARDGDQQCAVSHVIVPRPLVDDASTMLMSQVVCR